MTASSLPRPTIPPFRVPPESLPADAWFKSRPATYWIEGDLVELDGAVYRIKGITHSQSSARIAFTLYPCAGGLIETRSFMPRQWFPVARGV